MTNYEQQKEAALDAYLETFEKTVGSSDKIVKTVSFPTAKLVMDAFSKGFDVGLNSKIQMESESRQSVPSQYHDYE